MYVYILHCRYYIYIYVIYTYYIIDIAYVYDINCMYMTMLYQLYVNVYVYLYLYLYLYINIYVFIYIHINKPVIMTLSFSELPRHIAAFRRLPVRQRVPRAPPRAQVDGSVAAAHWSTRLVPGQRVS